MSKRLLRRAFVASALIATLAVAGPAYGWVETARTGTTGPHSLTDTKANPGAICIYKPQGDYEIDELKRIYVNPPNIMGVAGQGDNQKVAWQFMVQRREWNIFEADPGPWSTTYTSSKSFGNTDPSHSYGWDPVSVKVNVPLDPGLDASYQYRVLVKAFWYRPNATVRGTSTMRIERYAQQHETETNKGRSCWDYL
jgi:hypothetical protein